MRKNLSGVRVAVLAGVVLALAACGGVAPTAAPQEASMASVTPTPTPSPTPVPTVLLVSVTGLAIIDSAGAVVRSIDYTDEDGTVDFLTDVIGAPPELDESFAIKGAHGHLWPGVTCTTGRFSRAFVGIEVDSLAGLTVQTADGIHVGSTRDEVLALDPLAVYDSDGDGLTDWYGIEVVSHPGTQSLSRPGEEGIDYVQIRLSGDTVTQLYVPSSDWTDV
jgi:hypothetical protein